MGNDNNQTLSKLRLGIVGAGVVGHATARCYTEHVAEVRIFDVSPQLTTHTLQQTLDTDLIFVCLPTPRRAAGMGCDTDVVSQFFAHVAGLPGARTRNYVLRSTVPVGFTFTTATTNFLGSLVHSPEFLTARCAAIDAHIPSRNIIGVPGGATGPNPCAALLARVYEERFPGIQTFTLSSDESEAVKLFQNGFFAVKLAYWNEVYSLARRHDMDWQQVMAAVLADGRVAHSHTKVPGPDGRPGFGGACLPKDLANLIDCIERSGLQPVVTAAAHERNCHDRAGRPVRPDAND